MTGNLQVVIPQKLFNINLHGITTDLPSPNKITKKDSKTNIGFCAQKKLAHMLNVYASLAIAMS